MQMLRPLGLQTDLSFMRVSLFPHGRLSVPSDLDRIDVFFLPYSLCGSSFTFCILVMQLVFTCGADGMFTN